MPAWWSGTIGDLRTSDPVGIAGQLAANLIRAHSINRPQQERAWRRDIALLASALSDAPSTWRLLLEYPLLRLERRIDAVLITERAILVLEFKGEIADSAGHRQVVDYALDLFYFHSGYLLVLRLGQILA